MANSLTVRLATRYPCHGRRVVLGATRFVPIERYERCCPDCGFDWTVERRSVPSARTDLRLDVLEWSSAERAERGL